MGLVEKKLGRNVAHHRKLAGLTQAKLAEKVRVATETVSRLERGVAMPSLSRMEAIAGALGVELHDLFRFRDRESKKDRALDRLLAQLRRRNAEDVEVIADVAVRVFERWR